jgi:hypothetical protein
MFARANLPMSVLAVGADDVRSMAVQVAGVDEYPHAGTELGECRRAVAYLRVCRRTG